MPTRFDPEIDQLRVVLRATRAAERPAALRTFVDSIAAPALAADNTSRYIAANRAASELTGYTTDELLGMSVADLTPAARSADGDELWREFVERGFQRGEYEIRRKRSHPLRVRYWAYASVAPGIHVSILAPVTSS